eukprot:TRINITY_DN452_c0_g2_i2.p1 TRINITY_DN452_c0_g2~~TRINITY_DN452_c0_g2_i2.p1  ORF type:complete len:268 (-),score=20.63 TRINITY_DN452_c0_g2_i2:90-893(-)
MQDLQLIANGTGRMYGGDRRLRPHPNQALKCPRCDSLNTKFCYYNNYNLSQPRHFCKSCRRYWTKGGVLRNVPVGGGCRKTKRSKPKPSPESQKDGNSGSNSSSDGSTLTATVPATSSAVSNFPNSRFFSLQNTNWNPSFEPVMLENVDPVLESSGEVFRATGSFTSLMTPATNPSILGFGLSNPSPFRLHYQQQQNKMEEARAGVFYQTVPIDLPGMGSKTGNGSLTALECQSNGDQGLCDLLSSADQVYWSESQWGAQDHSLYLP